MEKRNIKLTIEFDGTNYSGWQSQDNATAIQDVLTASIYNLTGEKVILTGSSRTDAGVHAKGHVSNFYTTSSIPSQRFAYALNSFLPPDISVIKSEKVPLSFHSRFDAKSKSYTYMFINSDNRSALYRNFACYFRGSFNMEHAQKTADCFLGKHDFKAFMATGSVVKDTVREIYESKIYQKDNFIIFKVKGNGFLYNMVRIMAGTIFEAATGRIDYTSVPEIIISGNRKKTGRTLPAHGLYLVEVFY